MLLGLMHILGYLLTLIGGITLSVSIISYVFMGELTQWIPFFISAMTSIFIGGGLILGFQSAPLENLQTREIFLLTFLAWILTSIFASLPIALSTLDISLTDTLFETVSAITTTGATVLTNIESYPKTILLWRALLQWFGGVGIVIMAMTILPKLKVGGMQLFQSEFSDKSDKVLPQVTQIARSIFKAYIFLTALCILLLYIFGLTPFDAICHGFTTVATGGIANYDESIGHFKSPNVEWVIIVFMLISSLPLISLVKLAHHRYASIFNSQVNTYLLTLFISICALWLWVSLSQGSTPDNFRHSVFTAVSIITTAGFSTNDYNAWGGFAIHLLLVLSMVGACTGSTSGGIKIFRLEVLSRITSSQIKTLRIPHGIFRPTYQGKVIDDKVTASVITFFMMWALTLVIMMLVGSAANLDPLTAISGAVAITSNVGPGMGDVIGPAGSYAHLPDAVKWTYIVGMLLGRLEFVTILALASKSFWKH